MLLLNSDFKNLRLSVVFEQFSSTFALFLKVMFCKSAALLNLIFLFSPSGRYDFTGFRFFST